MRKWFLWMAVTVLLLGAMVPALAERPRIILFTAYRQVGWGDAVQLGCVDMDGGLWVAAGHDAKLEWPYGWEKQVAYLQTSDHLTEAGRLSHDELFSLKSLISCVQATEAKPVGWMCDAGTESSWAVRYDRDGNPEAVLLGMTGDDLLENTDVNAQALYLKLRALFPFVRSYAGEMTGWGFQPVSLAEFCHLDGIDWDGVKVSAYYNDCESGPKELEVTEDKEKEILDFMKTALVTGKENATDVTGGMTSIFFSDRDGKPMGAIELYGGLLIRGDGMYSIKP